MHPPDLAFLAGQAHQRVVIRQNENVIAGDPWAVTAGDLLLPDPVAAAQIDRGHAAAMADREDPAAVDDRAPADIGKAGHSVDAACRSEAVGPGGTAVLDPQCK